MLKGVIFDADGTLLDSMRVWRELGKRYLNRKGIAADGGLADILYPMSLEESSVYLKRRYGLTDSVERIVADTLAMIEEFYLTEVSLKQGVASYLEELRKREIPMIIATSGSRDVLVRAFERLQIGNYFQGILTCSELGVSKREAAVYLSAAEKLGTKPRQTVVFEDVLHGVVSAKAAGFITVAVEDFSNERDRQKMREISDYSIRDFTDVVLKTI